MKNQKEVKAAGAGMIVLMFGLFLNSSASAAKPAAMMAQAPATTKTLYTVPNDRDEGMDFSVNQTLPVKAADSVQASQAPKDMSTASRNGAFELKLINTMRNESKTTSLPGTQPAHTPAKTLIAKS